MKKVLQFLAVLITFAIIIAPALAQDDEDNNATNKVITEALNDVVVLNKSVVKLRVLEEARFENGIVFEKDCELDADIAKIVDPKRGKRNGYIVISPKKYTVPSKNKTETIQDEYWMAKVIDHKPFDVKNAALSAGVSVAGLFVKGFSQAYYFGKGVIQAEDGENRLKSGAVSLYKNSPLAYIEEGKAVDINEGDVMLLKFYYSDVPVWKFWERNK